MASRAEGIVLGAGMSGLAAGIASGFPVYEAAEEPGGICRSYHTRPDGAITPASPADGEAWRFEVGGGHWIFGGDEEVERFLAAFSPLRRHRRRASVFFPAEECRVPYPLQYHLGHLRAESAARALVEIEAGADAPARTLAEWLHARFGPTLGDLFFDPFHEAYTAGLWETVAPAESWKTPVDPVQVRLGLTGGAAEAGYNASFLYPECGLGELARRLAAKCELHYGRPAVRIDPARREVAFADGTRARYGCLVSTLPLHRTLELAGLRVDTPTDPWTSVLVLNLGAERGPRCPDDHWLYVPRAAAGFFRVGLYSEVEADFLPRSRRGAGTHVGLYVERAWPGGQRPGAEEIARYARVVVRELTDWGWIGRVEVLDPTWIDVAYTWSWPESRWRERALRLLESHRIHPVGRYGRWRFQGIARSIREGLAIGARLAGAAGRA